MTQLKEDRKDKLKDLWVSSNDFKRSYGPMAGAACTHGHGPRGGENRSTGTDSGLNRAAVI